MGVSPAAAPAARGGAWLHSSELRGGSPRGRSPAAGGSSSATPQPQVPGRLRWNLLCTLLRGPAIAAARPGPLFRRPVSSGQVPAAPRGARTCQSRAAWSAGTRGRPPGRPRARGGDEVLEAVVVGRRQPSSPHHPAELGGAPPGPDLDLYLLFPPRTLLGDEPLLRNGQTSHISALSPFPASGGWGRAELLHPARERDRGAARGPAAPGGARWGSPLSPASEVDAWLVHSVAAGDADGAHALLGTAAASSAGGVGAGVDGVSQVSRCGGGVRERFRVACWSPRRSGEGTRGTDGSSVGRRRTRERGNRRAGRERVLGDLAGSPGCGGRG